MATGSTRTRSRRSSPEDERASGKSQAEETAEEEARKLEEPIDKDLDDGPQLPEEAQRVPGRPKFRTPGFSRMRTSWSTEDGIIMLGIQTSIEDRLFDTFADAYVVMNDLFEIVRKPEVNEDGEAKLDRHGFAVWARKPNGSWDEDWTRLTKDQKENFLFEITTRLWGWEMRAADGWSESMFAKAQWEERFAIAYAAPHDGTIEDRTSAGKRDAAEERYFAIFVASYSRKADALVRTMALLGQRLKDSLVA